MVEINITNEQDKTRLDRVLENTFAEHTRSNLKKLIDSGNVLVNGNRQKAGYLVRIGDRVTVDFPPVVLDNIEAQDIPLDIVYQDDDLLVVNKPRGMTVHPAATCKSGTLVNALLYQIKQLSSVNGEYRPGIVHRLDKDTTGLMLVAKNDFSHNNLASQIKQKSCVREYIALLTGVLPRDEGEIVTNIGRDPHNRQRMAVLPSTKGKQAITHYWVLKRYSHYTLVRFRLGTGRTHQIRVHAKYMGHPVVGDPVYNGNRDKFGLSGQLLHSAYIEFTQPHTLERLHFEAPLPKDFEQTLQKLD